MLSKVDCSRSNAAYSIEEESDQRSHSEAARSRSGAHMRSHPYSLVKQNQQTFGTANQNLKSGSSIERALSQVQHRSSIRNVDA